MKVKKLICIISLSTMFFGTQSFAQGFQLQTNSASIQLNQTPKNIAVYDLATLDTLNALNINVQIVPDTTFAANLAPYQSNQSIKAGTLFEPDFSKLDKLKPDLIFIGGRSAKKFDQLNKIAPTVYMGNDNQHYLENLTQHTQQLAKAFDREAIAQQKLQEIAALQAQLKEKTQGKTAVMLFAVSDHFIPQDKNDRFGFVYDLTGFKSILPPSEQAHTQNTKSDLNEEIKLQDKRHENLKSIVKAQPDYLIVLDRGAVNTEKYAAKETIFKHTLLSQAYAVKEKKVIFVDANAWYLTGAGLDNTIYMLKTLIQAI